MESAEQQNSVKQIVYAEYFDQTKGNLLEVTNQFLNYIDEHEEIDILGKIDENVIFSTDNQTFRLKGINLPTSLLVIDQNGIVNLEVNNYIKMDEYDHEYEKIYDEIMETTFSLQQFQQMGIQALVQYYGRDEIYIKYNFKISMAQFNKFQVYLDFVKIQEKWLFVPLSVEMYLMRQLLLFLAQNNISTHRFTYEMVKQVPKFDSKELFQLLSKKFYLQESSPLGSGHQKMQEQTTNQKFDIESESKQKYYKISYASIYNFVLLQMASAKKQYISKEMDELVSEMIAMYMPPGVQELQQSAKSKMMAKHFIQGKRNNTPVRFYYNPLALQSTVKGRLTFMSSIKTRFSYDEILGIFDCMIIKDSNKTIKQKIQNGRKSIDLDDVLLKNFRKFGKQYQVKLIMPK